MCSDDAASLSVIRVGSKVLLQTGKEGWFLILRIFGLRVFFLRKIKIVKVGKSVEKELYRFFCLNKL